MTPPRLVQLKCPTCHGQHWVIDSDFRAAYLAGGDDLEYEQREYACPHCRHRASGHRVLEKSPPEFFLQPHPMYPMTTQDFAHWLSVFQAQFPSDDRLKSVGVFWYPGEAGDEQARQLRDARDIGTVQGYRLSLSNNSPDDERIRVCVQGKGEAHFWCGSGVDLDHCYFGFEADELEKIRKLLAARSSDIRRAWQRFAKEAKEAQARWLPKLIGQGDVCVSAMQARARIALGVTVTLVVVGVGSCVQHINKPRVIDRTVAPDGTEMCIVQQCNWSAEPFTTSFVYRKPGGRWGRFYFDHEDVYWGSSRVSLDTNAQKVVFYRGGSPAVTFSWPSETYTMHRWNRTMTGAQWEMPTGWSPEMPVH